MINNVIVEGIMYGEAREKVCSNGVTLVRFSIRVHTSTKRLANGKYPSVMVNCVAFGEVAKYVKNYIRENDKIIISGNVGHQVIVGPRGGKRVENYVSVNAFSVEDKSNCAHYEIVPIVEKEVDKEALKVDALDGWDNRANL